MSVKTCVVFGYTYTGGMSDAVNVFETGYFGNPCKHLTAKDFIDSLVKEKGNDFRVTNVVIG